MATPIPTTEAYAELQDAFDHFNRELFEGALPSCLITMQREKSTCGYFSAKRFVHKGGQIFTDEIAINPSYFSVVPTVEVMQTMVHEMVHLWQHHFGTPGRGRYHNREWADKMEAIGLMPSSTGKPGGAKTGEKMGDYPIEGGRFLEAFHALEKHPGFGISWIDRFPPEPSPSGRGRPGMTVKPPSELPAALAEALSKPPEEPVNRSNRIKQRCSSCGAQAWGKPGLKLLCGEDECNSARFLPAGPYGDDVEPVEYPAHRFSPGVHP